MGLTSNTELLHTCMPQQARQQGVLQPPQLLDTVSLSADVPHAAKFCPEIPFMHNIPS